MGLSDRTAPHYSTELRAAFSVSSRPIVSTNDGHGLQFWLMLGPQTEHGRPEAPAGTTQAHAQPRSILCYAFKDVSGVHP